MLISLTWQPIKYILQRLWAEDVAKGRTLVWYEWSSWIQPRATHTNPAVLQEYVCVLCAFICCIHVSGQSPISSLRYHPP